MFPHIASGTFSSNFSEEVQKVSFRQLIVHSGHQATIHMATKRLSVVYKSKRTKEFMSIVLVHTE